MQRKIVSKNPELKMRANERELTEMQADGEWRRRQRPVSVVFVEVLRNPLPGVNLGLKNPLIEIQKLVRFLDYRSGNESFFRRRLLGYFYVFPSLYPITSFGFGSNAQSISSTRTQYPKKKNFPILRNDFFETRLVCQLLLKFSKTFLEKILKIN